MYLLLIQIVILTSPLCYISRPTSIILSINSMPVINFVEVCNTSLAVGVRDREYTIEVRDSSFQPQIIVIEEGDRIWWEWTKDKVINNYIDKMKCFLVKHFDVIIYLCVLKFVHEVHTNNEIKIK